MSDGRVVLRASPFYCDDCKDTFGPGTLIRHWRCLTIRCNWCHDYDRPPSDWKAILDHQGAQRRNVCMGRRTCQHCSIPIVTFNVRLKIVHSERDCFKRIEAEKKRPGLGACDDCGEQLVTSEFWDMQTDLRVLALRLHLTPVSSPEVILKRTRLLMQVIGSVLPNVLLRLVAEYDATEIPCSAMESCGGCLKVLPKATIAGHQRSCAQLISCPGCRELWPTNAISSHYHHSPKCLVLEPCDLCLRPVEKDQLAVHRIRCPMAKIRCPHCRRKNIPADQLQTHLDSNCPNKPQKHPRQPTNHKTSPPTTHLPPFQLPQ